MSVPHVMPAARRDEFDALLGLLLEHAEGTEAPAMAERIAKACMGERHLWRDMRLGSRDELRAVFEAHFPSLAEANDRDMRWKRFLYKRLCGWEGFAG
ncbi:MAG: nitrogen fixation protein NifQ [Coriobacteriia bacterium]